MSSSALILLLTVLFVLVAGLQLYKKLDQARTERLRRVARLNHAYRLTQRYLNGIPGQYFGVELQKFLLQRAIVFLGKLTTEDPRNALHKSKLSLNQGLLQELQAKPKSKPTFLLQDINAAKEASALLTECARFVGLQARRESGGSSAASMIRQLNWYADACMAEFHLEQAKQSSKMGDHTKAINHLNHAILRFSRHPEAEDARQQLQACQTLVNKETELLATKQGKEGAKQSKEGTKLDQDLGLFLEEEARGTKKSPFD